MSETVRPRALTSLLLVLVALAGVGCGSSSSDGGGTSAADRVGERRDQARALRGAPEELASLHSEGGELLDGGLKSFDARLKGLRGRPVVVNKWASWCGPCRAEFPHFQRQSTEHGKEVAFLGVDGQDNDAAAQKFLDGFVLSFPSYKDPDLAIAKRIKAVAAFPSTVFYDREGEIVHIKQGQYATEKELAADISRYAR